MLNYWVRLQGISRRNIVEIEINLPQKSKLQNNDIHYVDRLHNGYWITSVLESSEAIRSQFDALVNDIFKMYTDDSTMVGYLDLPITPYSIDVLPLNISDDVGVRCSYIVDRLDELDNEHLALQQEYSKMKNIIKTNNSLY